MSDGIILNPADSGQIVETTELANGRQLESVRGGTIDDLGAFNPYSTTNPVPVASAELKRIRRMLARLSLLVEDDAWTTLAGRIPILGPAPVAAAVPVTLATNQPPVGNLPQSKISTLNSTTRPLAAFATWVGGAEDVSNYAAITVNMLATVTFVLTGQPGFITLQWSQDGTTWTSSPGTIGPQFTDIPQSGVTYTLTRPISAKYVRVVLTASDPIFSLQLQTLLQVACPPARDPVPDYEPLTLTQNPSVATLPRTDRLGRQYLGGVSPTTGMPRDQAGADYYGPLYGRVYGTFCSTGYNTAIVAAAKAANTTLMAVRNVTAAGNASYIYITRIKILYEVVTAFAAAAVPSSLVLQLFSGVTPTGTARAQVRKGVALSPGNAVPGNMIINDSNAALGGAAPTFGNVVAARLAPTFTVSGSNMEWALDWDAFGNDPLVLTAGNGLALRTGTNAFAATGTWMYSYTIDWIETAPLLMG